MIEIVKEEEQSFSTMLERGIKYFEEEVNDGKAKSVTGEKASFCMTPLDSQST